MRHLRQLLTPDVVEPASLRAKRLGSTPSGANEFTVTFVAGGHELSLPIPADDVDEAIETFRVWLDENDEVADGDDWRVVDANLNGELVKLAFRASWIAAFSVGQKTER